MLPQLLVLSLAVAPNLVSGALFPEKSLVKMIGPKEFKAAMKENMTSVVAFVAPWCGHCQRMAPEYGKAALGLHPLIPMYAVDCDAAANKRLCADQGVKGFPAVKLFPRGKYMDPIEFDGPQRSASEFYYFAQRGIPNKIKKVHYIDDLEDQINGKKILKRHRALLMKKTNKMPLLWSTLANKYGDDIEFFSHRDRRGKSSVKLGFEKGEDGEAKVLIYPAGEKEPRQFMGILKHDSLSRFFDSLLDGSANFDELNAAAAAEEFVPDPEELEIERQQEAEMLKLAHGGFANMIDFEEAVRGGSAKDFHGKNGYPGMMGGAPPVGKKAEENKDNEKSQSTSSSSSSKKVRMPKTDEAGQVVIDANVGPAAATATPTANEAATEVPTETPESVSERRMKVEPEPESEAETVVVDGKVNMESTAVPESPIEPSAEADDEHIKDEL